MYLSVLSCVDNILKSKENCNFQDFWLTYLKKPRLYITCNYDNKEFLPKNCELMTIVVMMFTCIFVPYIHVHQK